MNIISKVPLAMMACGIQPSGALINMYGNYMYRAKTTKDEVFVFTNAPICFKPTQELLSPCVFSGNMLLLVEIARIGI